MRSRKTNAFMSMNRKAVTAVLASSILLASVSPVYAAQSDMSKQMENHMKTMEENLKSNPSDLKLAKRLQKAKDISRAADEYLQMERQTELASKLENPTAGISSLLGDIASSSLWREGYYRNVIDCLSLDEESDYFHGYYNLSEKRKEIVDAATSCEGKIHYVWGGKPSSPDFKPSWKDGIGGLDCSGFVTWVYWHALGTENADPGLMSTFSIARNKEEISYEELLPGDLGMITDKGTYYTDILGNEFYSPDLAAASSRKLKKQYINEKKDTNTELIKKTHTDKTSGTKKKKVKKIDTRRDTVTGTPQEEENTVLLTSAQLSARDSTTHASHVGIYVGKDKNGNDLWCHCTGGSIRTVVVNNYDRFQHYYRVLPDIDNKGAKKDVTTK